MIMRKQKKGNSNGDRSTFGLYEESEQRVADQTALLDLTVKHSKKNKMEKRKNLAESDLDMTRQL